MSHYGVAVFADNPYDFEALLAPYDECNEDYYKFIPLEEDGIEFLTGVYNRMEDSKRPESFERFLTDEGYVNSPEDGSVIGYYANPNAKWDWYSLDGWAWLFDLKKGEKYDDEGNARKNQYRYKKDEAPYAYITPDGKWHAPGNVGWFGNSDDTPESYDQYLKEWQAYVKSDENPYVNFVDCHI